MLKLIKSVNYKILSDNESFEREVKTLRTSNFTLEDKLTICNKRLQEQDESYDGLLNGLKKRRRE